MKNDFSFAGLFTYDLANNHQGDLEHGLRIISEIGSVNAAAGVRGAFKFQFRHLESFIHPDFKQRTDIKHIPRFMGTALEPEDYRKLTAAVREQGMITMATPFDEESVDLLTELDIEIIKIASCSAGDWPLLEKVARARRPVVASTAGLSLEKIDRLVSFFEFNRVEFALMHCVALYPTPIEKLELNQIQLLRERFPEVPIGFSTHEDPDNLIPVQLAYALGARLFERHVGLNTNKYQLNTYSSTPEQIAAWLAAYREAVAACGGENRAPARPDEIASLRSLMRGVYAAEPLVKGEKIKRRQVFFAMPLQEGQLTSGEWVAGCEADRDYEPRQPLAADIASSPLPEKEIIYRIMLQVKGMLNQARIAIGRESEIEISHHYGLERFREFGAVIITCINRQYCKKLVIQLPRQKHPYHYHARKEETFQLLHGDLEVELEGRRIRVEPGDTVLVEPGQWHKFHTLDGAIFEEVSTTHFNNDSFYEDERIARRPRAARKTVVPNWSALV